MRRKSFIKQFGLGSGMVLLGPTLGFLQSCEYKPIMRTELSLSDIVFLDEIGETIIPATQESDGAKATNIGQFILLMYKDCMPSEEQTILVDGINELDIRTVNTFQTSFMAAKPDQRKELLGLLQQEAIVYKKKQENAVKPLPHYFELLKSLTLHGYFTSEIGMTQAREYLPVPGKYESCISYKKGDKLWAL